MGVAALAMIIFISAGGLAGSKILALGVFSSEANPAPGGVSSGDADARTADFAVTPFASPTVREFVESKRDSERSTQLARIVIPLVLLVLVKREILAIGGRSEQRLFLLYQPLLIASFVVLLFAQLRAHLA